MPKRFATYEKINDWFYRNGSVVFGVLASLSILSAVAWLN